MTFVALDTTNYKTCKVTKSYGFQLIFMCFYIPRPPRFSLSAYLFTMHHLPLEISTSRFATQTSEVCWNPSGSSVSYCVK